MMWFKNGMRCVAAYAVLLLYLGCNIYAEHSGRFIVGVPEKLAFAAGFIVLWTIAVYSGNSQLDEKQKHLRLRWYFVGLFCYYMWVIGNMLFFDAAFGRTPSELAPHARAYRPRVNLQPLRMIRDYLRAYENGNIKGSIVMINLLGNFAAFAPMGFFLPALFRRMRSFFCFTLSVAGIICAVEAVQYLTGTGSCDIDDLLLNLSGALMVWLLTKVPPIKHYIYRAAPPSLKKGW